MDDDSEVEGEGGYIPGVVTAAEVDDLQGALNAIRTPESISFAATVEDYQEVIQETQLLARNLLDKLRIAQLEIVSLRAAQRSGAKRAKRKSGSVEVPAGKDDEEITQLGRRFFVTQEMWFDPAIFQQPKPMLLPDDKARYANPRAIQQGVVADLYKIVPPRLHELMQHHSSFSSSFNKGFISYRATVIHRLRADAIKIYNKPGFQAVWFELKTNRAEIPELQALLKEKDPSLPNGIYSVIAPILHPQCIVDRKTIFRTKILRMVLFGPNSVSSDGSNVETSHGGRPTMAKLWNLNSTTPGCVAFAAIMARYLASPDVKLEKVGALSRINYYDDFTFYKRLLITGKDTASIKVILRFFDEAVFGIAPPQQPHTSNSHMINVNDFLADMEAGENASFEDEDFTSAINNLSIVMDEMEVEPPAPTVVEPVAPAADFVAPTAFIANPVSAGPVPTVLVPQHPSIPPIAIPAVTTDSNRPARGGRKPNNGPVPRRVSTRTQAQGLGK
ncbi:hypothetical protein HETIRDRAFT_418281 [Heterobasidion irregulare TC 32-1]|uniref:Uncharacterized protein n=1 Tax=Heterobasidion irregulare (strain TC 32-1) TaxID=747525 RepID=W4K3B6_HETIT|nr:uncharacterized protein HETIRDRAFT_418281 [Heterobasidion irregulare TC 32-1]ETW80244.1 hypothetical protein HETIRDRAFT_418281 [Heterobasidion irregulare TC 32-1]